MMADGDPLFLHDVWTYRFHDPEDPNWNLDSYHHLADLSTVDDFWDVHLATMPYIRRGMFFVMREHVFPCWDDKHNITGGCLSMKVLKSDVAEFWEHLVMHVIGERMLAPSAQACVALPDGTPAINGLSVSPKRFFCIVKIWLATDKFTDRKHFRLPPSYTGEVLFRSNIENIKDNQVRDLYIRHKQQQQQLLQQQQEVAGGGGGADGGAGGGASQ